MKAITFKSVFGNSLAYEISGYGEFSKVEKPLLTEVGSFITAYFGLQKIQLAYLGSIDSTLNDYLTSYDECTAF